MSMNLYVAILLLLFLNHGIDGLLSKSYAQEASFDSKITLQAVHNDEAETISIFRADSEEPLLVQNIPEETRPYIHPIVAPDGQGVLTQLRPEHHTHQTGLYWGLKRVNERDYFMACCKPGQKGYYQRVSANVIAQKGVWVKWQTVYDLLDEGGNVILTETQNWSLKESNGAFLLDLEWKGEAKTQVTIAKYFVGGLFLRMPWHEGIEGKVINAAGQVDEEAEAQRAIWTDIGMQIKGRDDWGHIAIFDHPDNTGFPIPWRVDSQLGVGPSRQIMGDWKLDKGEVEIVRYRLVTYTGELNSWKMNERWNDFILKY